jgi:delta 1-pyrroline-5-carboxylate dehydrogenase
LVNTPSYPPLVKTSLIFSSFSQVVKPSHLTPYSALALCELAHRAGLPPGILSVVTASAGNAAAAGDAMCESPDVRKLSFTGEGCELRLWGGVLTGESCGVGTCVRKL